MGVTRNMRNIKLVLAYDGTEFAGWQVQPDAATIQGTLAQAIEKLTSERILPQGSGRTDEVDVQAADLSAEQG